MWEYNYTDNLLHSGVKGMKWGQRLYQNKDGSLTALGKQRYGTKGNYEKVQAAKRAASPEKLKAAKARAKAQARTEAEIVGNPLYNPNRHAMVMKVKWNESGEPEFSYC